MELESSSTHMGSIDNEEKEFLDDHDDLKREKSERSTWARPIEFVLNIMGYSVGVGNVWRFPYLCYKNGGGAFLIPYLLVLILCGFPILLLELGVGQYTRQSALGAWNIVPLVKGVAASSLFIAWYYVSYNMVLMGWFIFYFVHCFTTSPLPWSTCDNAWNSNSCTPTLHGSNGDTNATSGAMEYGDHTSTSSMEEFWTEYVLRRTEGVHDMGSFTNWRMILCFLCAWILSYLSVFKGIKTSGKVAYFTVLTPYVMFTILLVRGVTLEGAADGVWYYIIPRLEKLRDPTVWLDGGGQALYTLGVCCLSLFNFGSYNKFHTNFYKFAIINIVVCCGTSIFVGFIIFSYLGNMAFREGKNITEVAESGPGLVFQVFPASLAHLPVSQVWSAISFFTLILVAIDSVFGTIEGCTSFFQNLRPKWFDKAGEQVCRIGICAFPFLLGLPMLLDGGIYVFEIVNMYGNSGINLLLVACCSIVAISWIYGVDRFFDNIQEMIGYRPNIFIKYCYLYFAPGISLCIFVAFCVQYSPLKNGDYEYPGWANAIGWILSLPVIAGIPMVAAKTMLEQNGTLKKRWKGATSSRYEQPKVRPEERNLTASREKLRLDVENTKI